MEDLTGGVTTVMLGNCILRKDKLWREMVGVDQASNDFVFALSASGESGALRKNGLVLSHAYSILKATEIQDDSGKKLKLLKIKSVTSTSALYPVTPSLPFFPFSSLHFTKADGRNP